MQEHTRRTRGFNGSKAPQRPRLLVRHRERKKEEVVCLEELIQQSFRLRPSGSQFPAGPFTSRDCWAAPACRLQADGSQ